MSKQRSFPFQGTKNSITQQVASQYAKWVYPEPIADLNEAKKQGRFELHAPRFLFHKYWPNKPYREELDILVAGCGANMAASYAFFHPRANVTGIDISDSSLEHEQYLKKKHGLKNLKLINCTVENVHTLGKQFDYIDCYGVLHHLAQPELGLRSLKGVLKLDGVIVIMLYGKYGRQGLYMLQELFQRMRLEQSVDDLNIVKDALRFLGKTNFMPFYLPTAIDLKFDSGIVDSLLHKQDIPYTVLDCLNFVEREGLVFQGWVDNTGYYPEGVIHPAHPLAQRINALDERKIWQAMELYYGRQAKHVFFACRSDRDVSSYSINIESEEFLGCIPVLQGIVEKKYNEQAKKDIAHLLKPQSPVIPLNDQQEAMLRFANGTGTVKDCISNVGVTEEFARNFFRSLWRLGYVYFRKAQ